MLLIKPGPVIGTGLFDVEPDFANQRFVIKNPLNPIANPLGKNNWFQVVDEASSPNGFIAENSILIAPTWNALVSTYVGNSGLTLNWITASQLATALPRCVEQAPVP